MVDVDVEIASVENGPHQGGEFDDESAKQLL